ncbi:MAG: hypothetical protein A2167_04460 [Planctomycetes bacterium RBG_13_46_10]|nr:MAG: hypothetical protein A2167_04460 [Planctomycetes bacterium RBG_13_46_10]
MSKFKPKGRGRKFIREENPNKIRRQMTKNHLDVLQNIEFSIVTAWRNNSKIDDKVVASALKTAIEGVVPVDELSVSLVKNIEDTRLLRADVPDEIWKNGLKVVLESVYNHSDAQTGDTDYLDFVSAFIY